MLKSISVFAIGTLFVAAAAVPALKADSLNRDVTMSFSNSVEIPGMVLPAGTYVFHPLSTNSGAVAVMNQDQTKTLGLEMTIPVVSAKTPDKAEVRMAERRSSDPEAISSWFYPGDQTGYQFVYPKDSTGLAR